METPAQMTAVAISKPGGPAVLQPVTLQVPMPAPGEVLIRVAAAGVNMPDVAQRRGLYDPPHGASPLPGLEVSGIIAERGEGVTSFERGDEVVALTNGGGYAEYVVVPAGQVLPLPRGWSLVSAAALPETFFTVTQGLLMRAGLAPGMDLLVTGAAGGIGGAAIMIGKALGARPIAVVSSEDKVWYVEGLGAAATIIRTREDLATRTKELTAGKGADRIVDVLGGEVLARAVDAAARGAHIVCVGSLLSDPTPIPTGKVIGKWLTVSGSTLRPQPPEVKAAIAARLRADVWPALEDGRIGRPRIRAVPLELAPNAHIEMEKPGNYGKLVLLTAYGQSLVNAPPIAETPDNPVESV